MTELDLYKFIHEQEIEYRWDFNREDKRDDIIVWIPHWLCESFAELVDPRQFTDGGGIECRFQSDNVVFWMYDICEYYGINPENIFKKESDH